MKKAKITFVGAGSVSFCPATVVDVLRSQMFATVDVEMCLMDILPKPLELSKNYCEKLAARLKREITITATTNLQEAVDGADFVITAIEKDRFHYWSQDFHIPRRYGFRQIFGENGGPGSMFHTLRNLPPLLEIAHAMEKGCPNAWMLNYTNPEAKLVEGVGRFSKIKVVGLCHGEAMGADQLALFLQMPRERIGYRCVGLNHFGWFTKIWDKETGEDLYPKLREMEAKANYLTQWDEWALTRIMFRTYGLWPYPGANHIGEYIAWSDDFLASAAAQFYFDPAADKPWETGNAPKFVYSFGNFPNPDLFEKGETDDELYEGVFNAEGGIRGSGEYGIPIAEAIFFNKPTEIGSVNLPNKGYAKDLPEGMVIELPALVDGNGIHPHQCDPLPTAVAQMISTQGAIHKLVLEAYEEQSRNKLLQAVLLDPTVSGYQKAVAMINEICELQKDILPPLKW